MKRLFLISLVVLCAVFCSSTAKHNETPQEAKTTNKTVCDTVKDSKFLKVTVRDTVECFKAEVKDKLVNEVRDYIKTKTSKKKAYYKLPDYLVNKCLENNLDICFVMAQTEVETCFGTAGIGRESSRHSLFGIYETYSTYPECIDRYISVLKNNYLVGGKTEQSLMRNYVSKGGHRYAGNKKYEEHLSGAYRHIKSKTSIHSLQNEYKKAMS